MKLSRIILRGIVVLIIFVAAVLCITRCGGGEAPAASTEKVCSTLEQMRWLPVVTGASGVPDEDVRVKTQGGMLVYETSFRSLAGQLGDSSPDKTIRDLADLYGGAATSLAGSQMARTSWLNRTMRGEQDLLAWQGDHCPVNY